MAVEHAVILSNSLLWDKLFCFPGMIVVEVPWLNDTFIAADAVIVDVHAMGDAGQKPVAAAWVT